MEQTPHDKNEALGKKSKSSVYQREPLHSDGLIPPHNTRVPPVHAGEALTDWPLLGQGPVRLTGRAGPNQSHEDQLIKSCIRKPLPAARPSFVSILPPMRLRVRNGSNPSEDAPFVPANVLAAS